MDLSLILVLILQNGQHLMGIPRCVSTALGMNAKLRFVFQWTKDNGCMCEGKYVLTQVVFF